MLRFIIKAFLGTSKAFIIFFIIVIVLWTIVGLLHQVDDFQQPQTSVSQEIECYVNGNPIKASRKVCAELSRKQPQQVVQPQTQYQAPIQAPQINIPKDQPNFTQTNCHTNFDGSVRCYTKTF